MATINASTNEKIIPIRKWAGLNEHPDGDTTLKVGEASVMKNFRVTRDGNLKRRPGSTLVYGMCQAYSISVATDTETLFSLSATDTWRCYNVATYEQEDDLNSTAQYTGRVELDDQAGSELGALTSSEAIAAMEDGDLFIWYDDHAWQITSITLSGTKYVWTGSKVRAVPTSSTNTAVRGLWSGWVGGREVLVCACQNRLYSLYDSDSDSFKKTYIGPLNTANGAVSFIPFDNCLYILDGTEYYVWDGGTSLSAHTITISTTAYTVTNSASAFELTEGYRPLVAITITPGTWDEDTGTVFTAGDSELTGENVNLLNGERRCWLSPDGTNDTFQLPETGLTSIDYVTDLSDDSTLTAGTDYTVDLTNGRVTFVSTPDEGVNTYEVGYTMTVTYRTQVTNMLFGELFSGSTDTRLFLYGDGTNKTRYSGMDYDGQPRADYFPDQYEALVGDENTPITSMIRHYSSLICYKLDSAWNMSHGVVQLSTDDLTPAIYTTPVNRDIGNLAPGQVRLVNNNPVTCFGNHLYHWSNSSYYTSNLTRDERQAKRISDRVKESCAAMDFSGAMMWDDNDHQEFYICEDGVCLVWNYAVDAWYLYDLDAVKMCNFQGDLYYGASDGALYRLDEDAESDNGDAIEAEWISGAMDFSADYCRKYSSMLWVGLKPEDGTSVDVTVRTDRKDTFKDKVIPSSKAKVDGEPFMVKTKIKAKKFVYYRLIFESSEKAPPVTVTAADIRVRMTGYAK